MKLQKTLLLLLFPFYLFSQVPDYYNNIDFTLSQAAIQSQLSNLVTTTHTYEMQYTPDVWYTLQMADLSINYPDNVLLLYGFDDTDNISKTDRSRDKFDNCTSSSCVGLWNREHVFPRSLATPSMDTSYPSAGTDAHNLRACDSQMNSSRSNRIFEDGTGPANITPNGNFYPGDEWKGDVARIIMYMYLRYPQQCEAISVGAGPVTYATLGDIPDIFLEWNASDPVSAFEIQRNEVIAGMQGNRNPFIDNPYIATKLWNGPAAEDTWSTLSIKDPFYEPLTIYPNITFDYVYVKNTDGKVFDYSIYNVTGQMLLSQCSDPTIDLSPYESGMYFIRLQTQHTSQTVKVILK